MLQKEKYMDTEKKCMMKKFRITSFHVCEIWRSKSATCILAEFLKKKNCAFGRGEFSLSVNLSAVAVHKCVYLIFSAPSQLH